MIIAVQNMFSQNSHPYRQMINKAEQNRSDADLFLNKMNQSYAKTKKPVFLALAGVANFFQAKHSHNPLSKLNYFNKGKKMLDNAAARDKNNLEIRFLRYISQKKTPKIIGYDQHLKEDEQFLRTHLHTSDDEDLVKEIKRYLNL